MDANLANSQLVLAQKQRELAKHAKFQLPPIPDLAQIEREHSQEVEELAVRTNSLKTEADTQAPVWDPIAQIQQKKIQLIIAERQLKCAEKQIQIIQAHLIDVMDPEQGSALGRQSELRISDELRKQAQPLLIEATDLIKKARHSVTFAELGARQRLGSRSLGAAGRRGSDEIDMKAKKENTRRTSQLEQVEVPNSPKSPTISNYREPGDKTLASNEWQPIQEETGAVGVSSPMERYEDISSTGGTITPNTGTGQRPPQQPLVNPNTLYSINTMELGGDGGKGRRGACLFGCGCAMLIIVIILLLLAGGAVYALHHFDYIQF